MPGLKVVWTGSITPAAGGLHRFRLYSSGYAKVFVDGREVLEPVAAELERLVPQFRRPSAAGQAARHPRRMGAERRLYRALHADPRPDADRHSLTFTSELAKGLDYYFVGGSSMDDVIAGYRQLTGKAPIMPKWAYGFWQSRQRYETQDQLLGVLREYRKRGLPLDNIVQDWDYWPEDGWGCQCFDPGALPRSQGDGRRGARQRRPRHDLGLGEILSQTPTTTRSSTPPAASCATW